MKNFKINVVHPVYEGEEIPPETKETPKDKKIEFTPAQQAHLNGLLAAERRKMQSDLDVLRKQAEALPGTEDQLNELRGQFDTLTQTYRTQEEQLKHEKELEANKYKETVKTLSEEKETWQKLFKSTTIKNDIITAAGPEVFDVEQVYELLSNKADVITDKGKHTTKIKMTFPDKDNNPVELLLTPKETIERMKTLPQKYGNLFKSNVKSGSGTETGGAGDVLDKSVYSDPAKYRAARAAGKLKV